MAKVTPVFVDFETFWSATHSLTKMNPIEYVMHPETEIISCAIKIGGRESTVIFGEEAVTKTLQSMDWSDKLLLAHNNEGFDAMISAWRIGLRPKMWGCTLAMARPLHAKNVGLGLGKLVTHYGLGVKDSAALINTKGRHLKDFTSAEINAMREYNKADVDQCAALFKILLPLTRKDEMKLIDHTIRMLVEPSFVVDKKLLEKTLKEERQRKNKMLVDLATMVGAYHPGMNDAEAAEAVTKTLASAQKFAALLRDLGVEVPMKPSPTDEDKTIPALAKTDEGFIALTESEDPIVAAAANARLGVKSTLLESRIVAFLDASNAAGGRLPVTTKYYGADTTGRDSGWGYNPLNLPRIAGKPSDALRNSLGAGRGNKVVVADLSGIELRVNMFLWKVPYAMALFQADPEKADLYKTLASEVLKVPIDKIEKMQRQAGKAMHLGCGFGLGSPTKYVGAAKQMAGIVVTPEEAAVHIAGYRDKHPEIVAGWRACHAALRDIFTGDEKAIDPWGLCTTCSEGIRSPLGMIRYPGLREEIVPGKTDKYGRPKREWVYSEGRKKARIYAGKVTENCLAAGTMVLTDSGWKPIERVGLFDRVHDGVSWVNHAGTIFKSVQQCVTIDGVKMTPDHEVLNEKLAWQTASQFPRPFRPTLRNVAMSSPFSQRREDVALDLPLRLREVDDQDWAGCNLGGEARGHSELRMRHQAADLGGEQNPRDDQAPSIRGLEVDAGPLSVTVSQGVEKLRRSWDNGVRAVARGIREFLGRHGGHIHPRAGLGPSGQQRSLLTGELPMGYAAHEHHEQTDFVAGGGHTKASRGNGHFQIDSVLSPSSRAPTDVPGGQTESYPVYDILNAGPQHRFVVLGDNGPFIVHNCVQHLARYVFVGYAMKIFNLTGRRPALRLYDELVYVVEEDKAQEHLDIVQSVMRTPPEWWPELVTWSEGDIGDVYGACK